MTISFIRTLIPVLLFFSTTCFGQKFEKLDDAKVDEVKVKKSQKFINDYQEITKSGSYYKFNEDATDLMKSFLTPEIQKAFQQQLQSQFGDYQSSKYVETWMLKGEQSLTVLRFKGKFGKSNKDLEMRVAFDNADKIAGYWVIPWSDVFSTSPAN